MPLSRGAISYYGLLFGIDAIRYISNIKKTSLGQYLKFWTEKNSARRLSQVLST